MIEENLLSVYRSYILEAFLDQHKPEFTTTKIFYEVTLYFRFATFKARPVMSKDQALMYV
jgi:hypothetical protein